MLLLLLLFSCCKTCTRGLGVVLGLLLLLLTECVTAAFSITVNGPAATMGAAKDMLCKLRSDSIDTVVLRVVLLGSDGGENPVCDISLKTIRHN